MTTTGSVPTWSRCLQVFAAFAGLWACLRLLAGFEVIPAYGPLTQLLLCLLGEHVYRFVLLPLVIAGCVVGFRALGRERTPEASAEPGEDAPRR